MPRLAAPVFVTCCLALGPAACEGGKKVSPADAAPPGASSGTSFGFVVPPPSAMIMPDSPDAAAEALPKLETWSVAKIAGEGVELRYPGEIFLLDEEKGGVLLTSQLTVAPVEGKGEPEKAEGGAPAPYGFRGRLTVKSLGLVDAAKAEKLGPIFPGDKKEAFVEATGRSKKLTVGARAAYMQRVVAHGFDASVVFVELGPKRTLVARFDTVGEELRPRVEPSSYRPEAWQLELVDKVLATVKVSK